MAVLKQTSPTAVPSAPSPKPSSTVPSASTKSAVGLGSSQVPGEVAAEAALVWVMGTYLRIIENEARGRPAPPPGEIVPQYQEERASCAARRHQQSSDRGDEGQERARGLDAAH